VPAQKLRHLHLAHAVFAHQRVDDPRFFQFARAAAGAVESVDGGFRGSLVGLHQTRRKIFNFDETARRAETLEAVDQFVTFLSPAYHHGR
jgi:hypothetical protein